MSVTAAPSLGRRHRTRGGAGRVPASTPEAENQTTHEGYRYTAGQKPQYWGAGTLRPARLPRTDVPHWAQKRAPAARPVPQREQRSAPRATPQWRQNRPPVDLPQDGQVMGLKQDSRDGAAAIGPSNHAKGGRSPEPPQAGTGRASVGDLPKAFFTPRSGFASASSHMDLDKESLTENCIARSPDLRRITVVPTTSTGNRICDCIVSPTWGPSPWPCWSWYGSEPVRTRSIATGPRSIPRPMPPADSSAISPPATDQTTCGNCHVDHQGGLVHARPCRRLRDARQLRVCAAFLLRLPHRERERQRGRRGRGLEHGTEPGVPRRAVRELPRSRAHPRDDPGRLRTTPGQPGG